MEDDKTNVLLVDIRSSLDAIGITIDRLVASNDADLSYAATTAALHLHAAQAELSGPDATEAQPPANSSGRPVNRAVDALADVVATINDRKDSLPAEQQTALARVAIHAAEARDALSGDRRDQPR